MLVVSVISVDAYPYFAFSDLTCQLKDTGIGVFWLHCAACDCSYAWSCSLCEGRSSFYMVSQENSVDSYVFD